MNRKNVLLSFFAIILVGCSSKPYSSYVEDNFKKVIGERELVGYRFYSQPRSFPTVGALFFTDVLEGENTEASLSNAHPRWWSAEIPEADYNLLYSQMYLEGNLGSMTLEENITKKSEFGMFLEINKHLASAGIDLNNVKNLKLSFSADKIVNRSLVWDELSEKKANGMLKESVRRTIERGDFAIVAADWVMYGYKITISVDEALEPKLVADLLAVQGIIKGGNIKFDFERSASGKFEAVSLEPVVAAVLLKRAPKGVVLSADKNVSDWETIELDGKSWLKAQNGLN